MEMLTFTEPFSIAKLLCKERVLRFWSWIYCVSVACAGGPSFYRPVRRIRRTHEEQPGG